MKSALTEREQTAVHETLQQKAMQLDYDINSYLNMITYISWNDSLRAAMAKDYYSNYEMYKTYKNIIDPMFLTMRSMNSDIESITLYTDVNIYPHGDSLRPLSEITKYSWYKQALKSTSPFFFFSKKDNTLQLICKMYYSYSPKNCIIRIKIKAQSFFNSIPTLFNNDFCFLINDSDNNIIYNYDCLNKDIKDLENSRNS